MNHDQYYVFIDGDCPSILSEEDLDVLKNNFKSYSWNQSRTFKIDIIFNPLGKMIHSWHRNPDQYGMNTGRKEILKLENYLPLVTIETLSYLDYLGEKIYSCIKQPPLDSEEEEKEWAVSNSSDLYKLMIGLENYLQTNDVPNHELVIEQVGKLKRMSGIAEKYKLEIILFLENP